MPIAEVRVCLTTNEMAVSRPYYKASGPLEQVIELEEACGVPHQIEHNTYSSKISSNGVRGLRTKVEIPASDLVSRGRIMPNWTVEFQQLAGLRAGVVFQDYIDQNLTESRQAT